MTIDSADDSKTSNRTITTNRISNRTYDSKSNRNTKLRRSLLSKDFDYYPHSFQLSLYKTGFTNYLLFHNAGAHTLVQTFDALAVVLSLGRLLVRVNIVLFLVCSVFLLLVFVRPHINRRHWHNQPEENKNEE